MLWIRVNIAEDKRTPSLYVRVEPADLAHISDDDIAVQLCIESIIEPELVKNF